MKNSMALTKLLHLILLIASSRPFSASGNAEKSPLSLEISSLSTSARWACRWVGSKSCFMPARCCCPAVALVFRCCVAASFCCNSCWRCSACISSMSRRCSRSCCCCCSSICCCARCRCSKLLTGWLRPVGSPACSIVIEVPSGWSSAPALFDRLRVFVSDRRRTLRSGWLSTIEFSRSVAEFCSLANLRCCRVTCGCYKIQNNHDTHMINKQQGLHLDQCTSSHHLAAIWITGEGVGCGSAMVAIYSLVVVFY